PVGRRLSAHGLAADGVGREVFGIKVYSEVDGGTAFVIQAFGVVTTVFHIVGDFQGWKDYLHIVIVDGVRFGYLQQLTVFIVFFGVDNGPGIFIHVVTTGGVTVAEADAQFGFDHPHPVRFIAQMLRVDVLGQQDAIQFQVALMHTVGVVGNVNLLFAF